MQVVFYWDFILLPVYLFILSRLMQLYKKHYVHSKEMQLYFTWAFWLKMLFAFIFVLLTQYFFGKGDTMMYYDAGTTLNKHIVSNPSNIRFLFAPATEYWDYKITLGDYDYEGYIIHEGNFMPMRLVAFLGFFTFRNFTAITLIFSTFSFLGLWKLFEAFAAVYPPIKRKIALACLFIPSVVFWSSTILKDTICITCLGFIVHSAFNFLFFKSGKSDFVKIIVFGFILFLTKYYIAFALFPALLMLAILTYRKRVENPILRQMIVPVLIIFTGVILYFSMPLIEDMLGEIALEKVSEDITAKRKNFEMVQEREGGAFFEVGEIDPSPAGLLRISPKIINAVFFRPYLWEASSAIIMISALESAVFLSLFIYTFFKNGPARFFLQIFRDNILLFCIFFSLVFAFFVGLSTPNFGSLVRYKIPSIPFYCIVLIVINSHALLKQFRN